MLSYARARDGVSEISENRPYARARDGVSEISENRPLIKGYVVETTTTGAAAIAAVRERSPDVVLLDLNMPGVLDGRAVLQAIHTTVPVIVVTAVNDLRDARATLQAGAFDFIAKPFDLNRVAEVVAAAVAYRQPP